MLYFECSNDVLTKRLLKRGESSGRADDNLASIEKRLLTFANMSLPVIEHYKASGRTKLINSEASVEDVTAETLRLFE